MREKTKGTTIEWVMLVLFEIQHSEIKTFAKVHWSDCISIDKIVLYLWRNSILKNTNKMQNAL